MGRFKGAHFLKDSILTCVRWHPRLPVEQSPGGSIHGGARVTHPLLGFNACDAAQWPLPGVELLHLFTTESLVIEAGAQGLTPAAQVYSLAASSSLQTGITHCKASTHTNLRQNRGKCPARQRREG